jgi:hypothetical protein
VGFVWQDESEARAEESIVAAGEEERMAQATLGDLVAKGGWDSFDQGGTPHTSDVVGHATR